jgi:hypothetical protein
MKARQYNVQNEKDKTKNSQQSTTQKTKKTETDVNQWRPDNTIFKMKRTKKKIINKALHRKK